jgi:hypothetical protein
MDLEIVILCTGGKNGFYTDLRPYEGKSLVSVPWISVLQLILINRCPQMLIDTNRILEEDRNAFLRLKKTECVPIFTSFRTVHRGIPRVDIFANNK